MLNDYILSKKKKESKLMKMMTQFLICYHSSVNIEFLDPHNLVYLFQNLLKNEEK